jgi:hypothetical protein
MLLRNGWLLWSRVSWITLLHRTALAYLFSSIKGALTRSNANSPLTRRSQLNHTWCLWKKQVNMQDALQTIKRECSQAGSGSNVGSGITSNLESGSNVGSGSHVGSRAHVGSGYNVGSGFTAGSGSSVGSGSNVGSSYICDALVGHELTRDEMCRDSQHTYLEGITAQKATNGKTHMGIIRPLPLTVRQRTHLRRPLSESKRHRPRKMYSSAHHAHDVFSCDGGRDEDTRIICETSPHELWRKAPPQGQIFVPHTTGRTEYSPCIPGEMPTPSASVFSFDTTAGQWVRKRCSNNAHAKMHTRRELLFQ